MSFIIKKIPRLMSATVGRKGFFTGGFVKNTFTATDAVMECPHQSKFVNYACVTVISAAGVSAGAWMSKNIASFLEENELFVPSDDDDDF